MKYIGAILLGLLAGFFVGVIAFFFVPNSFENRPLSWLCDTLCPGGGIASLEMAYVLHFTFWMLLGGFVFWAAFFLRSKLSRDD